MKKKKKQLLQKLCGNSSFSLMYIVAVLFVFSVDKVNTHKLVKLELW